MRQNNSQDSNETNKKQNSDQHTFLELMQIHLQEMKNQQNIFQQQTMQIIHQQMYNLETRLRSSNPPTQIPQTVTHPHTQPPTVTHTQPQYLIPTAPTQMQ